MSFQQQLVAFNRMYGLPVNNVPTNLGTKRLEDLKQTLLKEVEEIDDIIAKSRFLDGVKKLADQTLDVPNNVAELEREVLTDVADLMVDMQVYCGSELTKWGIPMEAVQHIVMESNMSKLGADGKPIINEKGKVEKGPHYWKPEPTINRLLGHLALPNALDPVAAARRLVACRQAEAQQLP